MKKIFNILIIFILIATPVFVFGQIRGQNELIPCGFDGPDCTINDFFQLIFNLIYFTIELAAVLSVFVFIYAGFLYITAQGDSAKISRATKIFGKVMVGFIIILSAYLIVQLITNSLQLKTWIPIQLGS